MMRALVGLLVLAGSIVMLGLTATGFAGGSDSAAQAQYGGQGGPSDDPFVGGGGQIGPGTFPGGFSIPSRDFSVDAHLEKKGTKVTGLYISGRNGITAQQMNITCISIEGNQAVVGGIDVGTGIGRVNFLIDNGPPSSPVRDQLSPNFTDPLDSPNWPSGFPFVCPTPSGGFNQEGYLDVHSGDIVISDGSD